MGSPFTYNSLAVALAATLAASTAFVQAWTPGVGNESDTSGFAVDTQSRNDVVSFWHCVYQQSEGYENRINWTGSIGSGTPGSTAAAFKNDVQRRINYYRAMAGMDASIAMTSFSPAASRSGGPTAPAGTTKEQAAQAAALMLSKNTDEFLAGGDVATGVDNPHNPPSSWGLDTSTARNGAYFSNLAIGKYGPGAIDAYMLEDDQAAAGGENNDAGHRRYLFYSRLQEVATGDVTATGNNYYAANALYVFGNFLPPGTPQFTPWPNAGFTPEAIVPERWSLTYPGADFVSATVTMTDINGDPVATTIVSKTANFADNTLIWKPSAASMPSAEFDDMVYNVTVSNVLVNGSPVSHSYTVTVINPNRLLEPLSLSGSLTPPDSGADYFFDTVSHAESYRLKISSLESATWLESADDTATIINQTTLTDSQVRSTNTANTSPRSLRLAFKSNTETLSAIELNRTFIPNAGSSISFHTRRGVLLSTTTWALQIKSGIGNWADLHTVTNDTGSTTYPLDEAFVPHSIAIPVTYHGNSSSLRIVYRKSSANTSFEENQHDLVGVFTDDITLINCDNLAELNTHTYANPPITNVSLNSTTAGEVLIAGNTYLLSLGVTVGCKDFGYGNAIEVTPVAESTLNLYELWFHGSYPIIGNFEADYDGDGVPNGLEHVFGLNPMDNSDAADALKPHLVNGNMELSHAIIAGGSVDAECSFTLLADSWQPVSVTISGGIATASIPLETPACYLRWKVAAP